MYSEKFLFLAQHFEATEREKNLTFTAKKAMKKYFRHTEKNFTCALIVQRERASSSCASSIVALQL
jgi:hypothetical protein